MRKHTTLQTQDHCQRRVLKEQTLTKWYESTLPDQLSTKSRRNKKARRISFCFPAAWREGFTLKSWRVSRPQDSYKVWSGWSRGGGDKVWFIRTTVKRSKQLRPGSGKWGKTRNVMISLTSTRSNGVSIIRLDRGGAVNLSVGLVFSSPRSTKLSGEGCLP